VSEIERPEGREGVGRVEAFSDGVLAIVITIMVLELVAPEEPGLKPLLRLWPTFLAYMLSYAYIAIYWVNHHRLFSHARTVTNSLVWSNIALLFGTSLIPFTTAYLGQHPFTRDATVLYMISLLVPALAYFWLEAVIRRTGRQDHAAKIYHEAMTRKGMLAVASYALAIPLAFASPLASIAIAAVMAVFWMLPWGPLDRLFLRCEVPES